jgi:ribosomal protein S18 acetylase RimI-like enzyme
MIIRKATLNDVPGIMQVIQTIVPLMRAGGNYQWDSTYPNPQVFEQDIAACQLWVADVDSEIAGAAAITTEQYPEYADVSLDVSQPAIAVHRLAVDTKFRGMGVAAALLMQAEQESVNCGFNLLRIDTNSQNKAAQSLFPKLGYVFAGEIGLKFRPGMRFYCYEKRLG